LPFGIQAVGPSLAFEQLSFTGQLPPVYREFLVIPQPSRLIQEDSPNDPICLRRFEVSRPISEVTINQTAPGTGTAAETASNCTSSNAVTFPP
jgi:hypothetical protein